jgi:hypothetical protein
LRPVWRFLSAVAYDFGTSEVGLAAFQILNEWAWLTAYQFEHKEGLPFMGQSLCQLVGIAKETSVVRGQCLGGYSHPVDDVGFFM